jgi:uncharacterized protein (DUF849 family)
MASSATSRLLRAIRSTCPGVPVGLTTGAWIEPDPERRLELVGGWEVVPDYASVNLREEGSVPLVRLLLDRGIDLRIGLEEVLELPDGQPSGGNGELVAAAALLAHQSGRWLEAPPRPRAAMLWREALASGRGGGDPSRGALLELGRRDRVRQGRRR